MMPTCKYMDVSIDKLKPDPSQPRKSFDDQELPQLAENLKNNGQIIPLIVVADGDSYILIDGERRYRAALLVGLLVLRCIVLSVRPSAEELLTMQLTVNGQRQDFNPIEKMLAYYKLMQLKGWNGAQLAEHLCVSKAMVTRTLALAKLSNSEQLLVAEGKIGSADAYALTRLDSESRSTATRLANEGKLGREVLEKLARTATEKTAKKRQVRLEFGSFTGSFQSEQAFAMADLIDWLGQLLGECKKAARKGLDVSTLSRVLADRSRSESQGGASC